MGTHHPPTYDKNKYTTKPVDVFVLYLELLHHKSEYPFLEHTTELNFGHTSERLAIENTKRFLAISLGHNESNASETITKLESKTIDAKLSKGTHEDTTFDGKCEPTKNCLEVSTVLRDSESKSRIGKIILRRSLRGECPISVG